MSTLAIWKPAALAFAAGLGLGVLAWGEGRAPVAAIALPLLLAVCRTRLQAFALAAGYAGGVLRYAITFIGSWFDDSLVVGLAAVLTYMTISGGAWCIGWSSSSRPAWRSASMAAAWLVALIPAAVAVPGHPLVAVGFLLPGTAWLGVFWSLVASAAAAGALGWAIDRQGLARARGGLAALCVALGLVGAVLGPYSPANGPVLGVEGVTTRWGHLTGPEAAVQRIERIGGHRTPAAAVVWPESILGRWDPAFFQVLDLEVLRSARTRSQTVVLGMDVVLRGNRMLNAAVAFYPDGTSQTAVARQPAPVSLWRPWQSTDTFLADWRASNLLDLAKGRAALIFCYEEYLPVLVLLNEAMDHPTMYVVLANTWAAKNPGAAAIQTWHSLGMARLFGRPYVKAENRPGETHSQD